MDLTGLNVMYLFRMNTNSKLLHTMKCACCGADMLPDKELENTIIYKCKECGLTDSRLKDIG
jgi:predicted  nucleic acid-binding Zn ribbon protein